MLQSLHARFCISIRHYIQGQQGLMDHLEHMIIWMSHVNVTDTQRYHWQFVLWSPGHECIIMVLLELHDHLLSYSSG
jgi:hypothetical protein